MRRLDEHTNQPVDRCTSSQPYALDLTKNVHHAEAGLVMPPAGMPHTVIAATLLQYLRTLEEPLLTYKCAALLSVQKSLVHAQ